MPRKQEQRPYRATSEQMRVLASPVRIEIVGVFQSYGTLAISELADKLSRPMDGLYHHVRQLVRVGILRVARTRRVGKRDEAVYELTAERFGHEDRSNSPTMTQAIIASANAALRLAAREYERAMTNKAVQVAWKRLQSLPGRPTPLDLSRQRTWLTDQDLRQLHEMIRQIELFLADCLKRRQGQPYVFTTLLVPSVKRKRI
jgi:DNA-binding transcriptional ArsR family regulator